MVDTPPSPPPGWFPDPSGALGLRYWDGTQWTPATAAWASSAVPPGYPPPRYPGQSKPRTVPVVLIVTGCAIALIFGAVGLLGNRQVPLPGGGVMDCGSVLSPNHNHGLVDKAGKSCDVHLRALLIGTIILVSGGIGTAVIGVALQRDRRAQGWGVP